MVKTWWYINCCMRWSCFNCYRQLAGALWLSLYCMKCKRHVIALLYHYALAVVVEAIVGESRSNSWRDNHDATMEIKVSSRWRWRSWRCFRDVYHKHNMIIAISYHLYWLHVMFILYASYLALIDGSILRWSLTNYQEVFSLSMHRCESSSCWDTTWWSGVIGSTFKYNGCKTVAHAEYSG